MQEKEPLQNRIKKNIFHVISKNFKIKIKSISHRESTVNQGVRRLYHSRTVCTDSACASPLAGMQYELYYSTRALQREYNMD